MKLIEISNDHGSIVLRKQFVRIFLILLIATAVLSNGYKPATSGSEENVVQDGVYRFITSLPGFEPKVPKKCNLFQPLCCFIVKNPTMMLQLGDVLC